MFELTELLDGISEVAIDLPIVFARSHATLLGHAVSGPFKLRLQQKHEPRRYVRPRTLALLEVFLLYAASKAIDTPHHGATAFANNVYVEVLRLGEAKFSDQVLAVLFGLLVALYCTYYVGLKVLRLKRDVHQILVDACLYYAMLSVFSFGIFVAIDLAAFNGAFSTANERLLRAVLLMAYCTCFLRSGCLVATVIDRRAARWRRAFEVLVCATGLFAVFAVLVSVIFGGDALWPNLNA